MFASFNVKQEIGKDIYIHILVDNKYFRLIILYFCFIKFIFRLISIKISGSKICYI